MESNRFANGFARKMSLGFALALALGAAACAGSPRRPEAATAQRLKDSAPERSAALRGATPGLALEAEDQRWGIEAAKQRKLDRARTATPAPAPTFRAATQVQVEAP
jgi:hypothetical protein